LNDWGYPLALAEVPCLLVSELVTNAILHTGTQVEVSLRLAGPRLRSAVADGSLRVPVLRRSGTSVETGRGLQLVEELATAWGVEAAAGGKTVWFEVDLAARDRLVWRRDRG